MILEVFEACKKKKEKKTRKSGRRGLYILQTHLLADGAALFPNRRMLWQDDAGKKRAD